MPNPSETNCDDIELPAWPHRGFHSTRNAIETAIRTMPPMKFHAWLLKQRTAWFQVGELLSADFDGLSVIEQDQRRALEANGVSKANLCLLMAWFDSAMRAVRHQMKGGERKPSVEELNDQVAKLQARLDDSQEAVIAFEIEYNRLKRERAERQPDATKTFVDAIRRVQSALDRHEAHVEKLAESADTALVDETHEASRAEAVRLFAAAHESKQPDALGFLTPELLRDRTTLAEDILVELVKQDGASAHPELIVKRAYACADALIAQSRGVF